MALSVAGKVVYSTIFLVLTPIVLVAWAASTERLIGLPGLRMYSLGVVVAVCGLFLMLLGMKDLWTHGGGLPMNADPPPRYVTRGIFRIFPHPIYAGFSLLSIGVSLASGSASGLWLVSPLVMLSCAALVLGYEYHDLRNRFGPAENRILPSPVDSPASLLDLIHCWLFMVIPLSLLSVMSEVWPVSYVCIFAVVMLIAAPVFVRSSRQLREFCISGMAAMPIAFILFLLLPLILPAKILPAKFFEAAAGRGGLWVFCPSPVVICAFVAAQLFGRRWPRARWFFIALAILASVGSVVLRRSGILEALAAILTVAIASRVETIWNLLKASTEHLANSWREWRFGKARLINHGFYAGMAGVLALVICDTFAGPGHLTATLVAALASVVGAALWAQFVEGSAQLLRPYGFYGGLLGGTLGALIAPLFHTSPWLVLAVFSVSGPWVQALGRLRCLVQGCCHGSLAPEGVGIRYVHPRSRVCRHTAWSGLPLHPTPLYSILWNSLIGLFLMRIWIAHVALSLIIGLYFILSGIGRFAEEGWRGEPQTQVVAGLKLYQWAAVVSILMGGLFSVIVDPNAAPSPEFRWSILAPASLFGLFVWFAMGLDFPESNRRFSRLT